MTILSWYNTGTVAVTNANAVVTGTATVWLANVDAREAFRGPDGLVYEIQSIDSDTQITLATTYKGATLSGQAYSICPLTGYERSLAADAASLLTKAGALLNSTPTTLDILQYRGTTWTNRNPSQYMLDLTTGPAEVNVASAGTCDIGVATSHRVAITGTTTITSLGTTANCVRLVRFTGALLLTYNVSSLILPGAANLTTIAGDTALFVSDGAGNWRCMSYNPASWTTTQTQNGSTIFSLINANTGTAALAQQRVQNSVSVGILGIFGTGYTPTGMNRADGVILYGNGAGGLTITTAAVQPIYFGINGVEVGQFDTAGYLKAAFYTLRGATAIASSTPTTIFAATEGTYIVTAYLLNVGSGTYSEVALVTCSGSGADTSITTLLNAPLMSITLSGSFNVQVTQSSGAPQTVNWSCIKIATR